MREIFMTRRRWSRALALACAGLLVGCGQADTSAASPVDDYVSAWGPDVGSSMPMLEAPDQTGVVQNLAKLSGESGLLLVLSRSADW